MAERQCEAWDAFD